LYGSRKTEVSEQKKNKTFFINLLNFTCPRTDSVYSSHTQQKEANMTIQEIATAVTFFSACLAIGFIPLMEVLGKKVHEDLPIAILFVLTVFFSLGCLAMMASVL
jgi:hypothetical protein